MPSPARPVLAVDFTAFRHVDTTDPENLCRVSSVFIKSASTIDRGPRLENLNLERSSSEQGDQKVSVTQSVRTGSLEGVPPLSSSVDSETRDEVAKSTLPKNLKTQPRRQPQDFHASDRIRGSERKVNTNSFEKMRSSITKGEEPSAPLSRIIPQKGTPELAPVSAPYEHSGSTTAESVRESSEEHYSQQSPSPETNHRTTIVHGFFKSQVQIVYHNTACSKITSLPAVPEPSLSPVAEHKIAQVGGSFEEDTSTKDSVASQRSSLSTGQMNKSSHADQILDDLINGNPAIDDDSDTECVDESAIDDDDSSDWEDSTEDSSESSSKSSTNEDTFQRVKPGSNLTSRRSLISLMIDNKDNSRHLGNLASQSNSVLPFSHTSRPASTIQAVSYDDSDTSDDFYTPLNGRSAARVISTSAKPKDSKLSTSPRTTRYNMLSTELTESLRRNVLWERQQKSSTANAVLKRRHTSHDVTNPKQYPGKVHIDKNEVAPQFKIEDRSYHSIGW